MGQVLKGIWNFLNSRVFVIIFIMALILFGVGQCKRIFDLNREIDHHLQNESALTDSLLFERKKNGELLVSIDGYISTEKELKRVNKRLWDEVQDQKGQVIMLTNTIIQMKQDSTDLSQKIDSLVVVIGALSQNGNFYTAPWLISRNYGNNNYLRLQGSTVVEVVNVVPFEMRHDTTYLRGIENSIEVTYGQKIDDDKLRVFIQSEYPGFTVSSMEGVLIDPSEWPDLFKSEKRHWFTGFGVGPELSIGWDFIQSKPALVIGAGIHYNVYEW